MNKRGISQLVATVLLAVFVIIIAIIIFSFISRTATQETEKSADRAMAQEICRDEVKIRVNNIGIEESKLKINVENLKGQDITDFIVRAEEGKNVDIKKIRYILGDYEEAILTVDTKSTPSVVKVIPQITLKRPDITSMAEGWWLCSDQMVTYKM